MTRKRIAGAVALAVAALALGAVFGQPGTGRAAGATPTNTSLPWIANTPQEGVTLVVGPGAWDGSPTSYAYAWSSCDSSGQNCATLTGVTGTSYTLTAGDVGHTLRVTVTATNGSGSSTATSAPTAVVSSTSAPHMANAPSISGAARVGAALSASEGVWDNNPTSLAYQWYRCDRNGSDCAAISGAINPNYSVSSGDAGGTLRVSVAATNASGTTTATSLPTNQVAPVAGSALEGCPGGSGTIQVAALAPPARLSIQPVSVSPIRIGRDTSWIHLHFRVTACNGRPVQGAMVYATAIPYEQFAATHAATKADGTATLTEARLRRFPASTRQELLAVLARASKPGESVVGGVSTRRVVSYHVSIG